MPSTRETDQHFKTRRLDDEMKEAHEASSQIGTDDHVSRLRRENRGLILTLIIVIGVAALAFWLL
jgi:hypothetical protein